MRGFVFFASRFARRGGISFAKYVKKWPVLYFFGKKIPNNIVFFLEYCYNKKKRGKEAYIMGKFVIREKNGKYSFRLKASNGEIIVASQMYKSLQTCKAGIKSVRANAPVANLEDQTKEGFTAQKHPKFEVYTDNAGEFRFRLKAKNGQIIAASEGYTAVKSCLNGIESVRKNAVDSKEEMEAPKA